MASSHRFSNPIGAVLCLAVALAMALPSGCAISGGAGRQPRGVPVPAGFPDGGGQKTPALGGDMVFMLWPFPLIEAFKDPKKGDELAEALDSAGITTVRLAFLGAYSPEGQKATERLESENKVPLKFPWFPIGDFADFISKHHFTAVVAVNVEEGPDVAEQVVTEFAGRHALSKLLAIELGNEPHLSFRPWLPEEYANQAAEIIKRLTPMGVHFGLPLTVGTEKKTPTRLSDNEWCTRMLKALSSQIDLKERSDIYGVIHLYSRGVAGGTIDAFNRLARPFMPNVRYLVTEFNIRSTLQGNPHLTDSYAMEFARKVAELMARPEVAALYSHAVPYHSVLYFVTNKGVPTVEDHKDSRLSGSELAPGWHLTPTGRVYSLFSKVAWGGQLVTFGETGGAEFWAVRRADGKVISSILNYSGSQIKRRLSEKSHGIEVTVPPHSIVCFDSSGREIASLLLHP